MFDTNPLSRDQRTAFLASLAHELTICARDTYEVGTDNVLEPQVLRAYNEILHRVTASVTQHLSAIDGFSVESIIERVRSFGDQHNRIRAIDSALDRAFHRATDAVAPG